MTDGMRRGMAFIIMDDAIPLVPTTDWELGLAARNLPRAEKPSILTAIVATKLPI